MSEKINYTEAFEELQGIVSEIEKGEISVDELSQKVKRASELIKICKLKLATTEEDVNKILQELDSTTSTDFNDSPPDNDIEKDEGLPF